MKDQAGFTLVEMLLVLLVITVLLLIMIPNVTKNSGIIGEKGCEALVKMVEAQVQAYRLENGASPTNIQDLNDPEYLGGKFDDEGELACPNGAVLALNGEEVVTVEES